MNLIDFIDFVNEKQCQFIGWHSRHAHYSGKIIFRCNIIAFKALRTVSKKIDQILSNYEEYELEFEEEELDS